MYEQFFNFMGLREDPFHVSPDPRFYYRTPAHESALTELLYGIETRQGLLVLTGEAGTGKTSLLNQILEWLHQLGRSSAYIFHTQLEPIGLLRFILSEFGVSCQSKSKSDLVRALYTWLLRRHAARDLPVLILDEAQALPCHTLDELRLLLNLETPRGKLLQIILSGQPELDAKLRLPALRQLRQRIMFHSRLPVLTQKETAAYISRRLAAAGRSDSSLFPDEVVQDIYTSSRGIPRVVNLLCEHALISAYAEQQHVISHEMIHRIAVDFDLCANPLAVPDFELQPHCVRFAPFPVIEKPDESVATQRFTVSSWEQIDFDIFKEPVAAVCKGAQPAATENPVPTAPPPAPLKSPNSVAHTVSASTPSGFSEIPQYWRRHRSRSAVALFARNSTAYVQRTWHAFTQRFRPARAVPPVAPVESLKPVARTSSTATPGRFSEISKYWRRYQSRAAVAVHNSVAYVQRAWHAFTHRFIFYAGSVSHSFVHDCRLFFRGLTLPTPALELGSSDNRSNEKSATHRNILAPIVSWLRQPMTPGENSSNRSAARSARRK
jgi:general secretion pathway protein A